VQADGERVIGKYRSDLPPMTGQPGETLVSPLLIELCLQTAGIWEIGTAGTLALPTAIERVVIHQVQENGDRFYAEIVPKQGQSGDLSFDGRVVDEQGNVYLELEGYRTARLPVPVDEAAIGPLRAVSKGAAT
jgi:hypothetical protein